MRRRSTGSGAAASSRTLSSSRLVVVTVGSGKLLPVCVVAAVHVSVPELVLLAPMTSPKPFDRRPSRIATRALDVVVVSGVDDCRTGSLSDGCLRAGRVTSVGPGRRRLLSNGCVLASLSVECKEYSETV